MNMSNAPVVHLFPSPITENSYDITDSRIKKSLAICTCFFVENVSTTRRWIKKIDPVFDIDSRIWIELHHEQDEDSIQKFETILKTHSNIGIFSDSGCPNIADPGQIIVAEAHKKHIQVIPFIGANSILLALMASGMNGQQFSFHGYLPVDKKERETVIKNIELLSKKNHSTQIFIETPYRNKNMVESILKVCAPHTLFCIASDITGAHESIKTLPIHLWKKLPITIDKIPSVFLLQA